MKRILSNVARFGISFGVLGLLIYLIGMDRILRHFRNVDLGYVGIAMVIFVVIVALMAVRWHVLLASQKKSPGYPRLLTFYFIGFFFNNFLPTAIGGDVSRAYYAAKSSGDTPTSIGSVVFERILGVLATLTLASISMIWVISSLDVSLISMTVLLFGGVVFALINLLNPVLFQFTSNLLAKITFFNIGEKINEVLSSIHVYRHKKSVILYGYLISILCQLLFVIMNFMLAKSLDLYHISFSQLLLVIPATFVLGLLPSVNGLGVRESGYVLFLAQIFKSTTADQAIALSLLNTSVPVIISLIGGIMLIFYRHKPDNGVMMKA